MSHFGPKEGPVGCDGRLSKETQALLAGMLKDVPLKARTKETLLGTARRTSVGTASAGPSSMATQQGLAGTGAAKARVAVPRVGKGAAAPQLPPARMTGKKTQEDLLRENPNLYDRERYTGGPKGMDREAEKDKLAWKMEMFGLTVEEIQDMNRRRAAPKRAPGPLSEEELYDAIFQEIQERWDHLEEMKRSGVGAQHEGRTRAEVAERIKQLRRLDQIIKQKVAAGK